MITAVKFDLISNHYIFSLISSTLRLPLVPRTAHKFVIGKIATKNARTYWNRFCISERQKCFSERFPFRLNVDFPWATVPAFHWGLIFHPNGEWIDFPSSARVKWKFKQKFDSAKVVWIGCALFSSICQGGIYFPRGFGFARSPCLSFARFVFHCVFTSLPDSDLESNFQSEANAEQG